MIKEGLKEWVWAYRAFLKAGITPLNYIKLSREERAFMEACFEIEKEESR